MAIIKYDSDYIKNQIIPYIDEAMEYLDNANRYTSYSIPSDFGYKEYLRGVSSNIMDKKNKLIDFKTWTDTCKTNFDNADFTHHEKIENIDDTLLKRRVSLIDKRKNM